MVEIFDGIQNIFEHGEVDNEILVFPIKIITLVALPFPTLGNGVMLFQHSDGMVCVLISILFHVKVVHTKGDGNRTPFMGPKTGC